VPTATRSDSAPTNAPPASAAVLMAITFLASFGTGVVWNGLAFITRDRYGYGEGENLLLALSNGAFYVAMAFAAGPIVRRLGRRISARGVVLATLLLQAACCPIPMLVDHPIAIWPVGAIISGASALMWPLVESYLAAGRHGRSMRQTIGWWNLVWMTAVTLSILLMGPFLATGRPEWILAALGVLFLLAALFTVGLPTRPGDHPHETVGGHVTPRYPSLLASVRVLLPLSYVLVGAISPLIPFLLDGLGTAIALQTPIASVWLLARVAAVAVLWRTHFWHGRWSTLLVASLLLVGGFAAMVLATSIVGMVAGLAAFGVGQGVVYYTALYYAMAVGRAEVDAGGTHEALIGLGYGIGPALAFGGAAIAGPAGIVGAIWLCVGVASIPAALPWWRERRPRAAPLGPGRRTERAPSDSGADTDRGRRTGR
jgi:MFS family permease